MKEKRQKGFTLIELLVVISIISLLSSVVLASLGSARSKARNARRNADIGQLITAFNLGFDANGSYPDNNPAAYPYFACVSTICSGGMGNYVPNATVDAFFTLYMQKPIYPGSFEVNGNENTAGYTYSSFAQWGNPDLFPDGPYFYWMLEGQGTSCGPGQSLGVFEGEDFTHCVFKLD